MNEGILTAEVFSFTKQVTSTVSISGKFLSPGDKVLIIDDFLANGQAANGLIQIIEQAGATVEAVGIVIEKSFQDGRELLEKSGHQVVSLCSFRAFENGRVIFKEAEYLMNQKEKPLKSGRIGLATLTCHVLRFNPGTNHDCRCPRLLTSTTDIPNLYRYLYVWGRNSLTIAT